MSEGDSISLQAVRHQKGWLLDSAQGFLVLHPDTLISGTAVVGSLFCARRSVLSNMFRGMDSDSPIMVIGSIVHELFQMVVKIVLFLSLFSPFTFSLLRLISYPVFFRSFETKNRLKQT